MTFKTDIASWCHEADLTINKLKAKTSRLEGENAIIIIMLALVIAKVFTMG